MAETETKGSGEFERPQDTLKSAQAYVQRWITTLELASEEEKSWRKDADEANKVYVSEEAALVGTAFNIYHANIETLTPALFNSTPLPDIRRRYSDRDPQAKAVADALGRCLSYSIDQYDFDGMMVDAVQDMAITGRGVMRVLYEPQEVETGMIDPETGEPVKDIGEQTLRCQTVPWASFRRGPARSWNEVEWVAFAHYMTRQELERISPKHGAQVKVDTHVSDKGKIDAAAEGDNPEANVFRRALVWEIWDREAKKVRFIAPSYTEDQLAVVDDPMGLKRFYPIPRPMMTGKASGAMVPLAPYRIQKPLLAEIDTMSKRITRLVKQLRPRALGPADVDIDALANADDGEIVGVSNVMQFLEGGGMDKMLAWFPLEPTILAVQQLYTQREQAKQALFEVSGLADIMRGASAPTETLGAQQIKQQWGSLRIQRGQQEIQRFVRDIFRIKSEIIAEKFTPQNIAMMSGIQLDDPAIQLITDEKMRNYRIDIETDSTIKGDLTRNMENMTQFVGGTAQYFQAIAPVVQSGGMSKLAAITIYSAFARNFKLGKEVDAVLDQLADEATQAEQNPQPPPPDPEMLKMQAQMESDKARLAMDGQKMQMEVQSKQQMSQIDIEAKSREFDLKREISLLEHQLKRDLAVAEMEMKAQMALQDVNLKRETASQEMQIRVQLAEQDNHLKAFTSQQDNRRKAETAKHDQQIKAKQAAAKSK